MKNIILIAIASLVLFSCGSNSEYTLNGEIIPAKEGAIVLYGFDNGNPVPVDTAEMNEGKFVFTREVSIPELALMGIVGDNRYVAQLFVEPGDIDLTIYPDSFQANVVVGSNANDIFQVFMDEMVEFSKSENDLKQRFSAAQMSQNEDELNNVRFEYETIVENTRLFSKNFISEYSESPVAAYVYLMNFFQDAELAELDSVLTMFDGIKESEFVGVIQERADVLRKSGMGAVAPDFTINDPDGNPVTLSDYRGKYVLIDFWASWCQPCMMELPNVIEQYNAFKDKGFEIVGVSLDRDREAWVSTLEAKNMNWPNGWDNVNDEMGKVANEYGVTGIPHTVLIDKEGKIIEKNLRGPALKAKLAELMN